jgi:hypothetical protein
MDHRLNAAVLDAEGTEDMEDLEDLEVEGEDLDLDAGYLSAGDPPDEVDEAEADEEDIEEEDEAEDEEDLDDEGDDADVEEDAEDESV